MMISDLDFAAPAGRVTADSLLLIDVVRAVLNRCGGQHWAVVPTEAWCHVTSPTSAIRTHGWKLHVAATPLSAPLVLARAAEVLVRLDCSFKFGKDIRRVAELVDVWYAPDGYGKFLTAYPGDDKHFRVLAAELHRVTEGLAGPRILSDKQLSQRSLVHYGHGELGSGQVSAGDRLFVSRPVGPAASDSGFRDASELRDSGKLNGAGNDSGSFMDRGEPDDRRRPDARDSRREARVSPPAWASSPLNGSATADIGAESVLLGGRFRVRQTIHQANKGGVFRAVDERDGTEVVIKQARAHVGARLDGTDVRDRLRSEARMLDVLGPLVTPMKVALIEDQEDVFLVEELVPGKPLNRWAADRIGEGRLDPADAVSMALRLVALMQSVHQMDLVIGDFKPLNLMVSPFGEIRLVDVEQVAGPDQRRIPTVTRGFAAPEVITAMDRAEVSVPEPSSDYFSLGVTLFCTLTALSPQWVSGRVGVSRSSAELHRLLLRIGRSRPVLTEFVELIVGLTHTDPASRWSLTDAEEFLLECSYRATAEPGPTRAEGSVQVDLPVSQNLGGSTGSIMRRIHRRPRTDVYGAALR